MKRALLLILGWLTATAWLYGSFVALDLYWNLFNWNPRFDGVFFGVVFSLLACQLAFWVLARASQSRILQTLSSVCCLFLLGVAVYVVPAEPLSAEGLLPRTSPSPWWYRGSRAALLLLPAVFWGFCFVRRRLPLVAASGSNPNGLVPSRLRAQQL